MQLVPCLLLALVSHPVTRHAWVNRVLWAFCVYVEAVSVAPQVIMMQHNRTVERFTGHYVFFLGLARFFSCAHWLLQMVDDRNSQLWKVWRDLLTLCLCTLTDAFAHSQVWASCVLHVLHHSASRILERYEGSPRHHPPVFKWGIKQSAGGADCVLHCISQFLRQALSQSFSRICSTSWITLIQGLESQARLHCASR